MICVNGWGIVLYLKKYCIEWNGTRKIKFIPKDMERFNRAILYKP